MLDNCKRLGVELVLIAFFAVMTVGFIITYVVAVSKDHVYPYFPYISDTGADAPESCIFTLVCSVGAILVLLIMYIRFNYIHGHYGNTAARINCCNGLGIVLGVLVVLGMLLVGSFQDDKVLTVHFIGAYMVFGLGVLYEWVQLFVSFRIFRTNLTSSRHIGKCVLITRLVLCLVGTFCLISTILAGTLVKGPNPKHWTNADKNYGSHVFSTVCEWVMVLTFLLYFLTFHPDFTLISVDISVKERFHHSDSIQGEKTGLIS